MWKATLLVLGAAAGFAAGSAMAQTPSHVEQDVVVVAGAPGQNVAYGPSQAVEHRQVFVRSVGSPGAPVEFVSTEFGVPGKVVKGAPYAADAVTETTQTLADGNRIVHKSSASLARDSEGRTRRDMTFPAIGGNNSAGPSVSVIYDPVTNTSYTLDHEEKVARKLSGMGMTFHREIRDDVPEAGAFARTSSGVMGGTIGAAPAAPATGDVVMARRPVTIRMREGGPGQAPKTESLGKQTMEGVVVEGTRVTNTIPAGQIGNERPIDIVSERWYSPELQTLVMSRVSDPQHGESVYKLTNIRRSEPMKSLFEVPPDYTVKTDGPTVQHMRVLKDKE